MMGKRAFGPLAFAERFRNWIVVRTAAKGRKAHLVGILNFPEHDCSFAIFIPGEE